MFQLYRTWLINGCWFALWVGILLKLQPISRKSPDNVARSQPAGAHNRIDKIFFCRVRVRVRVRVGVVCPSASQESHDITCLWYLCILPWCYVLSEIDVCGAKFISTLGKLTKNMPGHGGYLTNKPTTFGILAQCSANWATRSGRFEYMIFRDWA